MEPFDLKDLRELVEFLRTNEIAEFDLNRGDQHLHLKFASAFPPPVAAVEAVPARVAAVAPVQTEAATVASLAAAATPATEELHIVKSPIVGTFYDSPSPGAGAYVKPGDTVEVGQVLCIVEAMKLMNEIESDVAGEVVRVIARPGQPVEFGQQLFAVRAR